VVQIHSPRSFSSGCRMPAPSQSHHCAKSFCVRSRRA